MDPLNMQEKHRLHIVAAAIRYDDLTISLPPPARHGDIIAAMVKLDILVSNPDHQGFIDSRGNFRERRQALMIAIDANQIDASTKDSVYLYSEDLW